MWRKKNIISNSKILTAHFTRVQKIITLSLAILMLSFVNITLCFSNSSISALSYESEVGIGFTFNPTLSVSLSSNDLVIPNLTPGSSSDSNSISVGVATNASYGYTLSVNANSDYLTHSNNIDAFSSIALDADLANLTTDNTWGYSTSLDNGSSWSNYNGLSSSSSTTLLDTNTNNAVNGIDTIDFKIAAKAGSTQASGTYTNTITFTAVTKPTPMTLAEAYASEGKTMINGFYTMQDMTSTICNKVEAIGAQLQVLDIRDYKVYWIAKLADQKCWMTQNLDLDLDSNRTYTHWDTDLGWDTENGNSVDENASWQPMRSTINFTIGSAISGWQNSNTEPYSANPGDVCFYTSDSDANDIQYDSLQDCQSAGHIDCGHYHTGNYYNWPAAVANNDASNFSNGEASGSVCPAKWRLPKITSVQKDGDFSILLYSSGVSANLQSTTNYLDENGFNIMRSFPLYFVRSGAAYSSLRGLDRGYYNSSTKANSRIMMMYFGKDLVHPYSPDYSYNSKAGLSVRCLAR